MDNYSQEINKENIIVSVDIGASKIDVIMGILEENNRIRILASGTEDLKVGSTSDLQTTVDALKKAVSDAELMTGEDIKNVYVGIAGNNLQVIHGHGSTIPETGEVRAIDIETAVKNAAAVPPTAGEIIHIFQENFKLDEQPELYKNPINMSCSKLTALVHVVVVPKNILDNTRKCIEQAGLVLEGFALEPYAAGLAILSEEEKELGVAVLDIGASSSDLALFKGDSVWHTASLGAGGFSVTSDITKSFQVPIAISRAEEMKKQHGTCDNSNLIQDDTITVPGVGDRGEIPCSRKLLSQVMINRFKQIFQLYSDYLKKQKLESELSAGIVLTGGCASIEGIAALAESIFGLPVSCGKPKENYEGVNTPSHSVGVGLLYFASLKRSVKVKSTKKQSIVAMKSLWQRIFDFFRGII